MTVTCLTGHCADCVVGGVNGGLVAGLVILVIIIIVAVVIGALFFYRSVIM